MDTKYTAQSLASIAKARHGKQCVPDEEIYLGPLSRIDVQTCGDHSIWVENGEVYLVVSCPGNVHDKVNGSMSRDIDDALQSVGLRRVLKPATSANQPVENILACHARFEKSPDGSYYLPANFNSTQIHPVIVVEIAVNNESHHRVLCEASVWLNAATDVVYCIAVKIDVKRKKAYIYLLQRTQAPADKKVVIEKGPRGEKATPEIADELMKERPQKYCKEYKSGIHATKKDIQENYQVEVSDMLVVEKGEGYDYVFNLDLGKLLRRSNMNLSQYLGRFAELKLSEVIETLWAELEEPLEEHSQASSSSQTQIE